MNLVRQFNSYGLRTITNKDHNELIKKFDVDVTSQKSAIHCH